MSETPLKTRYAPPERSDVLVVQQQADELARVPMLVELLNAVPDIRLILNEQRQIVFANHAFFEFLELSPDAPVCGVRPGEAFNCIHADEMPAGCGTSEFCSVCGLVQGLLSAAKGTPALKECHILREEEREALTLRVWTKPVELAGQTFTFCAIQDTSDEERRHVLERMFFHDVLNTAGGLWGFAQLTRASEGDRRDRMLETIERLAARLIEEISSQRDLSAAETGDLPTTPETVGARTLLAETAELYRSHDVAQKKTIEILDGDDAEIETDLKLLGRVLGNMVKNALEASTEGDTVTLGCARTGDRVRFEVHNPAVMPREVQLQLFQRAFSTKGKGRGVGTYSMKLLTERYLGGEIGFDSREGSGTTFFVDLPAVFADPEE